MFLGLDLRKLVGFIDHFAVVSFNYGGPWLGKVSQTSHAPDQLVSLKFSKKISFFIKNDCTQADLMRLINDSIGVKNMNKVLMGQSPLVPNYHLQTPSLVSRFGMDIITGKSGLNSWGKVILIW